MSEEARPEPHGSGGQPHDSGGLEPETLVGLPLALFALPLAGPVLDLLGVTVTDAVEIAVPSVLLLVVVGIVVSGEGRPLSSAGVRGPDRWDVPYALVTFVGVFLALVVASPLASALGLAGTDGSTLADGRSLGVALAGAVVAGVVEEFLYRGYAVERLVEITDSTLLAGAVTWLAFTLAHVPGYPAGHVLRVSLGALVFTVVYLRRRTLVAVAHVAVNAAGVLSAVYA